MQQSIDAGKPSAVPYHEGEDHSPEAHESHDGIYILAFVMLAALTLIELVVTYIPVVKVILLLILASGKAALVAGYYMNLRYEKRIMPFIFVGPIIVGALAILAIQGLVLR